MIHAGRRLKAAREHLGLNQKVMANEIGVERTALTNWEGGNRLPDVLAMVRLMQRFGITLEWVYAGALAGLPYDMARSLEERAIALGASVGTPAPEWNLVPDQITISASISKASTVTRSHLRAHSINEAASSGPKP